MTEKRIKLFTFRVERTDYQVFEIPRGVSMIHPPKAWKSNSGEDVVAAVIDTGLM